MVKIKKKKKREKICYRPYNPSPGYRRIIQDANAILESFEDQGFRLTLRQLYYQFIAQDLFPQEMPWLNPERNLKAGLPEDTVNTPWNYDRLGVIMTRARDGGMVAWNHLVDRTRRLESLPHWECAESFQENVAPQFNQDLWLDQEVRVEVVVEKDALIEVLERACEPYDVPYCANRGYPSASFAWRSARHRYLLDYGHKEGKKVIIIHLGDHDPSGVDMTRDLEERFELYALPTDKEYEKGIRHPDIEVRRIALTMDQVEEYDLPPDPAKISDPRAGKYIDLHGDRSWELDALNPNVLVDLIQEEIGGIIDIQKFEEAKSQQDSERARLIEISERWEEIQEFMSQ